MQYDVFLRDFAQGRVRPGGGGLIQVALKMEFWRGEAALRSLENRRLPQTSLRAYAQIPNYEVVRTRQTTPNDVSLRGFALPSIESG